MTGYTARHLYMPTELEMEKLLNGMAALGWTPIFIYPNASGVGVVFRQADVPEPVPIIAPLPKRKAKTNA